VTVRAEEETTFTSSGFGTLSAVSHSRDGVEFHRDISVPAGAPAKRWSTNQDSMLGLQLSAQRGSELEATLQLISRDSIGTGYKPQVTWAFVKWTPTDDIIVRAGRLGVDFYLQGDAADIGYANLQVRQPLIFYPRILDGVDAEWSTALGDGSLRLKAQSGNTIGKLRVSGDDHDTQGSHIDALLLAEYAQSGWTARLACGTLAVHDSPPSANAQALYGGLASTPHGAEILQAIALNDRAVGYRAMALSYDKGPIQAMAGHAVVHSSHWSDVKSSYLQLGYRIDKITPYAAYTVERTKRDLIPTGIPWGYSAATDALNQGAALAQSAVKHNQIAGTLGLRYDLSLHTALKFQVDDIHYQDLPTIVDPSVQTQDVANRGFKTLQLYSASLEFVF
jgi:hypothetical protein